MRYLGSVGSKVAAQLLNGLLKNEKFLEVIARNGYEQGSTEVEARLFPPDWTCECEIQTISAGGLREATMTGRRKGGDLERR